MKLIFPPEYNDLEYNLVVINVALIPIAAGALKAYEESEAWLTSADYELGYTALAELQIGLADMTSILPVFLGGTGVEAIPSFSVHKNGTHQAIAASTWVKVVWSTEEFDATGNFASNRWTPQVAGKYLLLATIQYNPDIGNATPDGTRMLISIYKNGVQYERSEFPSSGNNYYYPHVAAVVSVNGSSDYFEIYTLVTGVTTLTIGGDPVQSHWSGVWVAP